MDEKENYKSKKRKRNVILLALNRSKVKRGSIYTTNLKSEYFAPHFFDYSHGFQYDTLVYPINQTKKFQVLEAKSKHPMMKILLIIFLALLCLLLFIYYLGMFLFIRAG